MVEFSWDKQLEVRKLVSFLSYEFQQSVGINIKDIIIEKDRTDRIVEVVDIYFDKDVSPLTNKDLMNFTKIEMEEIGFEYERMEKLPSCGYIEYHMYFIFKGDRK